MAGWCVHGVAQSCTSSPYLKLERLAVRQGDVVCEEGCTNRNLGGGIKCSTHVAENDTRLADTLRGPGGGQRFATETLLPWTSAMHQRDRSRHHSKHKASTHRVAKQHKFNACGGGTGWSLRGVASDGGLVCCWRRSSCKEQCSMLLYLLQTRVRERLVAQTRGERKGLTSVSVQPHLAYCLRIPSWSWYLEMW